MRIRNKSILAAGAIAALLAFNNSASAQSGEATATVVLPGVLIAQGIPPGNAFATEAGLAWSDVLGSLSAFADGELCATVPIAPGQTDDAIVPLGLDGQPSACSTEGALITVRAGALPDEDMRDRFHLVPGEELSITSLAPLLPESDVQPGFETTTIVIPGAFLHSPIPERGGLTWVEYKPFISVSADGERCLTGDLRGTGDATIRLGGSGQPAACSREGAVISFQLVRGSQPPIDLTTTFVAGTSETFTLDSFAPLPPALGTPGEPGTIAAPFARVVIAGANLDTVVQGASGGVNIPWGELLETIAVYANGQHCGTIDTVARDAGDGTGDATLALGLATQPVACRTPGALLTFRQARYPDVDMALMLWLNQGEDIAFNSFSGGESGPSTGGEPRPAPGAPNTGLAIVAPAGGGSPERSAMLAVAGAMLAALAVAGFVMARRAPRQ